MEIQGASSSSSNDAIQKVAISEATKDEPEQKKSKQDELGNPEETQNDTTIKDLPTEMLMKILKHVDAKNLIACRLLSRAWRDISTEILYTSGEIELQFTFDDDKKNFKQMINRKMGKRSLGDFLDCFKESKNCFYTHFLFFIELYPPPSKFENEDWLQFLSFIKDWIKRLKLVIQPRASRLIEDLSENLRDLLLNKLPRLEEFGLDVSSHSHQHFSSLVDLFPSEKVTESTTTTENSTTNTTSTERTETTNAITTETIVVTTTKTVTTLMSVQLPHLKVLHLSEGFFSSCPRIVEDLLKAAVNLKSIQDFGVYYSSWHTFLKAKSYVILHSHGKLNLLEEARMTPSGELFSACKQIVSTFKLKKLELCMSSIYGEEEEENWADASTFISHLFESCKDTLKELTMEPVGFLPDVKLPRFTKLENLIVNDTRASDISEPIFPSGINSLDAFPVLHTLDLDITWATNFPGEENIPRIPSVRNLSVYDSNLTGNCILKMSFMCPNVKDFRIHSIYEDENSMNFPEVGRAIWTHMKQLESLEFQIDLNSANSEYNTFHSLDSCFTGFSVENCKRLYELMTAEEYLKRWNSQVSIPKSELETPERESVSILDLKDLKNLGIKVDLYLGSHTAADKLPYKALTCVSEVYAFKLMPNLNYKIDQQLEH